MITEPQIIAALTELRALERLQRGIARSGAVSGDWAVCARALEDRAKWSRYALSLADPDLVARLEAELTFEAAIPEPIRSLELPAGTRVH